MFYAEFDDASYMFFLSYLVGVKQAVRFVRITPTVSLCKQKLSSNFKETKERTIPALICFRKKCVKNKTGLPSVISSVLTS